jgi:hypothetical protein
VQNGSIVITGTSGTVSASTVVNLTVTGGSQTFTLQSSLGSGGTLSVVRGVSGTVNLGISSTDGFVTNPGGNAQTALPVTYACSGLPSESTCTFSPASPTSSPTVTLTINTTAPTASLKSPFERSRLFYAMLLPGLMGVVLTFGSRKRSLRGLRILGFILLLGFSTIGISSCGGSNGGGGGGNPGTPTGSYTITVNATTSGPSSSTSFTLSVN